MSGPASVIILFWAPLFIIQQLNNHWAITQFLINNWPDILAFITGVLGVWLTIKQNIWCWPMALISVGISIVVFYKQRLFGDMSLQWVYFFAGIYGWIYWNQNKNKTFKITPTPKKYVPWLLVATAIQSVVYYFLLLRVRGDQALLDALLTAASLTATYMMTKKWLENWAVWVLIDACYILLYGIKSMWLFALLYLVFTLMALSGWIKWRKSVH
ncbi:MAG: nicotinamide mononucleotide transporter [Bacteroidia bacterium]|nr:nicotinamide mononucleotide transporter [Bacteroidia bacterium]